MSTIINSRADLDAIAGTPRHAAFIAGLIGTLAHEPAADFIDTPAPATADHERARWDGTEWIVEPIPEPPPPAPEPVPPSITRLQLIQQCVVDTWITPTEGEAWAGSNTLPAIVTGVIDALPVEQRTAARITVLGMTAVPTNDPLFLAIAQAAGATDAERDEFARQAALL